MAWVFPPRRHIDVGRGSRRSPSLPVTVAASKRLAGCFVYFACVVTGEVELSGFRANNSIQFKTRLKDAGAPALLIL